MYSIYNWYVFEFLKCSIYTILILDCVMAELEKLGSKYRIALRIVKDPRFERLPCMHKGTYADDCLVNRVTQHKAYIVATCDKDLKRRIRKGRGWGWLRHVDHVIRILEAYFVYFYYFHWNRSTYLKFLLSVSNYLRPWKMGYIWLLCLFAGKFDRNLCSH